MNIMDSMAARRLALGLFAAAIVAAAPARANLIVNGDFENPALWSAWTFQSSNSGTAPANINFGIRDASGVGHGTAANGSYVGGLEWNPDTVSLYQTVSGLIVGTQYVLAFDVNLREPVGPLVADSFRVMVDGNTVFMGGDPSQYAAAYVHESITFTATSASATTTFLGQFDSDVSYNIDNVVLTAAAVPEPATIALLGLGLAGMGFRRRETRTS